MKNIFIINRSLVEAGAEKQSAILASVLNKNHNVYLFIVHNFISNENLKIINDNSVKLILLDGKILIVKFLQFIFYIYKYKPDVIFSYLAIGNLFSALAGKMMGVNYLIGGIRNSVISPVKLPLERFIHNNIMFKTISNSYSAVENLGDKNFKKEKFCVIHNGFLNPNKIIKRNPSQFITIVSVSRFVPQKDFKTSIKVIKKLKMSNYKIKYRIIGYGPLKKEIQNDINNSDLSDVVEIILKPDNINYYYSNADIFLSTSLFEGMSNSIMEAMSFSLPIITTDVGDSHFLVEHNINGYLSDVGDVESLSKHIESLINCSEKRNQMGINSYNKINNQFNLNTFKEKYLSFINSLSYNE